MSAIQAIIFKKDYFTKREVDQWLNRHNLVRIKPLHETLNYLRARLRVVDEDRFNYRIKALNKGIKYVLQYPKYY